MKDQVWQLITANWQYSDQLLFVVGSVLTHSLTFWGVNALFTLFHYTGLFASYKLPRKEQPDKNLVLKCVKELLINQIFIQPISFYFVYYLFIKTGMDMSSAPPSWLQIGYEILMSFIINDFLFYWAHRTLHHPLFYAKFHKQHHQFRATIGIAAEYAGPLESVLANGIPTIAGPILFGSHPFTFWLYLFLRIWETVESHSGYDFPWSIWSLFDWQGGPEAHDFHHSHNVGNYGGVCFSFWDTLMGTDKSYREYLADKKKKL